MKAIELTKKLEKEVNLEQNMIMQRQTCIDFMCQALIIMKRNYHRLISIHQNQQLTMHMQGGS